MMIAFDSNIALVLISATYLSGYMNSVITEVITKIEETMRLAYQLMVDEDMVIILTRKGNEMMYTHEIPSGPVTMLSLDDIMKSRDASNLLMSFALEYHINKKEYYGVD